MPELFECTSLAKKALYKYSSFPFLSFRPFRVVNIWPTDITDFSPACEIIDNFSEREFTFMLSPVRLSSVPTQPAKIFGNFSTAFGTLAIR